MRLSEAKIAAARPAGGATAPTDDMGFTPMSALAMEPDGAELYVGAALPILAALEAILADAPRDRAGVRLHGLPGLAALLNTGPPAAIAAHHLGPAARPVRAVLFDKSPAANWALGWHQDRTIAVRAHHPVPGYGPWSRKGRVDHVEPPFAIIAAMVTLRIHLDDVPTDNAPLLIARGSHRLGRVTATEAAAIADRIGATACLAARGDVWAYATPILHASARSTGGGHRRVLQVDWSASDLPAPLEWLGV